MSRFVKRMDPAEKQRIQEAIAADKGVQWYVNDLKQERIALWAVIAVFALVIIIMAP